MTLSPTNSQPHPSVFSEPRSPIVRPESAEMSPTAHPRATFDDNETIANLVRSVAAAHAKHQEAMKERCSFSESASAVMTPQSSVGGGVLSDDQTSNGAASGGGKSDTKSQDEIKSAKSEPATETFRTSEPIVELTQAATELYLALGGADYRHIGRTSLDALEATLDMIREGYAAVKGMHLIPAAEVSRYAERFHTLLDETKDLMGRSRSPAARSDIVPPSPYEGCGWPSHSYPSSPKNAVRVDINDDEIYDVSVMAKTGKPDSAEDDELLYLKLRISELTAQKEALATNVERLEHQLKKQVESTQKTAADIREQHSEMERQVRWISEQVDRGVWLPTYGSRASGESSPPRASRGGSPLPPPAAAKDDARVIDVNDVPSVRVNKIDALYVDTYRGRGMEMIWNTIECVFKREYAVSVGTPTGTPTKENLNGNSEAAQSNTSTSATAHQAAYDSFRLNYNRRVGETVENGPAFLARVVETTPLRSDYIANCLSSKLKPNSGVVKMLTHLDRDADVEELSLKSYYIGDQGLSAVIPILSRLYRLKRLDLSDNGLKNQGIHQLCSVLQRHPAIEVLNVSNNPITRSGGKDLLSLASACTNVHQIGLEGTQLEPILKERIAHRTSLNADGTVKH